MGNQQELVTALQNSSVRDSSAYIITYDESGGFSTKSRRPRSTPTGWSYGSQRG